MSKSRILHALAMEELEGDDRILESTDVDADLAEPEEVTEGAIEVAESEGEIQENSDVVEELDEAAETLESIYYSLEAHREEGLSPDGAKFAKLAIEQAVARIGENVEMPAHESFEGNSRAVQSTELSLEGIKETLTRVWAKIKSWILKVWEAIKNFFKRWFTQAGRVKAKADNFVKYAAKLRGEPKAKKFKVGASLSNLLTINGVNNENNIAKGFSNINKALNDVANLDSAIINIARKLSAATMKAGEKLAKDSGPEIIIEATDILVNGSEKIYTKDASPVSIKDFVSLSAYKNTIKVNGQDASATDIFPGNVRFYVQVQQRNVFKNIFVNEFKVGKEVLSSKVVEEQEASTSSIRAIQQEAVGVQNLIDHILSVKNSAEKSIEAAKKELNQAKFNFEIKAGQQLITNSMHSLRRMLSCVGKQSTSIISYALHFSNASLNYMKLQAKQYSKA